MSFSPKSTKSVRPILLGGRNLSYECVRKKVKNINIRIRPDGTLFVSAPKSVSYQRIDEILKKREDFILRAMDRVHSCIEEKRNAYTCDEGAHISLMGKTYTIHFSERGVSHIEGEYLILVLRKIEDCEKKREALKRFAEKELSKYVRERFEAVYPLFCDATPMPELKLRVMRARWGSCRPKSAVITLNTRLAFYPTACIDYVIMHEFTHFLYANHSSSFWEALSLHMPDFAQRQAELNAAPLAEWF